MQNMDMVSIKIYQMLNMFLKIGSDVVKSPRDWTLAEFKVPWRNARNADNL